MTDATLSHWMRHHARQLAETARLRAEYEEQCG